MPPKYGGTPAKPARTPMTRPPMPKHKDRTRAKAVPAPGMPVMPMPQIPTAPPPQG